MTAIKNRKKYVPAVYAIECRCFGTGIRYYSLVRLFGVTDVSLNKNQKDAIFYLNHELKAAERHLKINMNNLDIESYDIIQVR